MSSFSAEINVPPVPAPPPLSGTPQPLVRQTAFAFCPTCSRPLENRIGPRALCIACGWKGQAYVFTPVPIVVERAQRALPQDATCLHHPSKRATAICAGTGDYICSLCAIELHGQTYSAAYLNNAGKEKVGNAFERYLPRPDSLIITLLLCCFIPYVDFVVIPLAPIWIIWSIFLYIKALRTRRTNPAFGRLMGTGRIIGIPIWLALFAAGWLICAVGLVIDWNR